MAWHFQIFNLDPNLAKSVKENKNVVSFYSIIGAQQNSLSVHTTLLVGNINK